jgi:hypothetical protein
MNYADFVIQANEELKDRGLVVISVGYNGGDVLDFGYLDAIIGKSLFLVSDIKEFDFDSCIKAIINHADEEEYKLYLKLRAKFEDWTPWYLYEKYSEQK